MLEVYFPCMWGFASHLVGFIRMLHAVYTQKTNMLEYLKSDTFLIIEMDKRVNFSDDKNTKSSILSIWPYNWRFRTVNNWHLRTVTLTLNQGVYPSCAQLMFFFSFFFFCIVSCFLAYLYFQYLLRNLFHFSFLVIFLRSMSTIQKIYFD